MGCGGGEGCGSSLVDIMPPACCADYDADSTLQYMVNITLEKVGFLFQKLEFFFQNSVFFFQKCESLVRAAVAFMAFTSFRSLPGCKED